MAPRNRYGQPADRAEATKPARARHWQITGWVAQACGYPDIPVSGYSCASSRRHVGSCIAASLPRPIRGASRRAGASGSTVRACDFRSGRTGDNAIGSVRRGTSNGMSPRPADRATPIHRSMSCPNTKTRTKRWSGKRVRPNVRELSAAETTRHFRKTRKTPPESRPDPLLRCYPLPAAAANAFRHKNAHHRATKRRCAPLDRANPPRTLAEKSLWISYPFHSTCGRWFGPILGPKLIGL